ncbi:MAG: maleylpyruvate isomerase N-terminal domain-containing protein [Chloroflexi bacterium]|nr:maleylpyruvate isomerase N-terminal domain-containing protein [Chloroflexota bacterium]MCZ6706856.1 maleylpyruvate isomerase N-terminal domain-containing protein [Chloroflexota bacterium]
MPQPLDRDALLAALRSDGDRVADVLAALPADALERGAYEQGWTVKDIAAHLASIEWTYPRLIRIAEAADQGTESSSGNASSRGSNPQMDDYNARQVAKRRETPLPQLIEEFRSNRAALIDAVEGTSAELLEREIQSFGGVRGSLLQVMWSVAVEHVRTHLDDLQSA